MFPEDFMDRTEKDLVKEIDLGNGHLMQIRKKSPTYSESVTGEQTPTSDLWPY